MQVQQQDLAPFSRLFESLDAICEAAVFQQLFSDNGEQLYQEVLDAGFVRLGRELTGIEADCIYKSLRRQYGADK